MQERLHAVPPLVLVDVETAVSSTFITFVRQLHESNRLDRLVLDEAHLVLTSADYRENLGLLGVLRHVRCPFVCLTATLPPIAELDLKQSLFLSYAVLLRGSSNRPNLEYCVYFLQYTSELYTSHELWAHSVLQLYEDDLRQWRSMAGDGESTARSLCYVRLKSVGAYLAERLGCDFYHAGLSAAERVSMVTAWGQGNSAPILVTTTALSAGLDYPSIRCIIHVDAPDGLVAYGQETGRAGRDRLHAVCTILLAPKWTVDWKRVYRNDFLIEDCKQMTEFLQSRYCRRRLLTAYLDGNLGGRLGTVCNDTPSTSCVPCSNCRNPPRLEAPSRLPS